MARTKRKPDRTAAAEPRRWTRRHLALGAVALVVSLVLGWGPSCRWLANRALHARQYERAEAWLNRSAVIPIPSGLSHFLRARLQRHLLNPEEATRELDRARQRGFATDRITQEEIFLSVQGGQIQNLLPQLRQMLLEAGDDGAELCEAFANGLLINGLVEDALALISAWKQEYPRDPQPYVTAGRWLESQRSFDEARSEYLLAVERQPKFAPAQYSLGRLQLHQSQAPEPKHYQQAADLLTANAAPLIGVARCLHKLGEVDAARNILERVVERPETEVRRSFALVQDPDSSLPAERLLGEILTSLGDYARGLVYLDKALAREPRDPSLRYQKAQCLQGTDRQTEAVAMFQQAAKDREAIAEADRLVDEIMRRPREPQVEQRFRVGELFWKHDSSRKAEFWLRATLAYDPRHRGAHQLLAELYELRATHDPAAQKSATYHREQVSAQSRSEPPVSP